LWILLWLAVRPFPQGIGLIRDKVLNFVTTFMRADLVRHDMIEAGNCRRARSTATTSGSFWLTHKSNLRPAQCRRTLHGGRFGLREG
jgi:hypothetical protein